MIKVLALSAFAVVVAQSAWAVTPVAPKAGEPLQIPRQVSNDCKTWVPESEYPAALAKEKKPSLVTYMQLVPAPGIAKPEITLTQFDSKNLTVVSDNPSVITEIREMYVPKLKQHNPDKTKPEFIEARTYADINNMPVVISRAIDRKVAENGYEYAKKSQDHQSWSLAYSPEAAQPTTFIYRFSDNDVDKASGSHLASRYSTMNCRSGRCFVYPKNLKHGEASEIPALTKTSMEMSELQNFKGFNVHIMADIDEMCSSGAASQLANKVRAARNEYNKTCKMKVKDTTLPKKIAGLCAAYKRDIRPLFKELF